MQKMTTRFLAIMLVQLTLVSTLYCQTALQQAISLVNASASPLPPGVTVSFGSVKGGFDAQFDPDGSKITISKENIAANHPDLVGDPGDLPVVLAVILHHEGKHAAEYIAGTDPPIYNSACGEVLLQHESAVAQCNLIGLVSPNMRANLCSFYSDVAECYNNGCINPGDGGASTFHAKHCQGANDPAYPGDIPPCAACDG